jgi:hypothetical protein
MTGLVASTTYHVRAYATNSVGTSYGSDITFSTGVAVVPVVTTTAVTVTAGSSTATSGGNVTVNGGATVTARGVCWSTSANPTTANSHTTDVTGVGTFTSTMTNLGLETTYHVRAYATNSVGTGYGSDISFVIPLGPCSECVGAPADFTLTGVTFPAGTECQCSTTTRIIIGPNVTIEGPAGATPGAKVTFKSATIDVKPGVNIKPGAVVRMQQN